MTASHKELIELWSVLATRMKEVLEDPTQCKASHLNVARQFLRDNGIDIATIKTPNDGAEELGKLIEGMPELDHPWPNDAMN